MKTKKTTFDPSWKDPELYPELSKWMTPVKTGARDDVYLWVRFVVGGSKI